MIGSINADVAFQIIGKKGQLNVDALQGGLF